MSIVLLSIVSYSYKKIGSKSLINLLSNFGIYTLCEMLETSLITAPPHVTKPGAFTQFVFDNCDINVDTIDGKGTLHNMTVRNSSEFVIDSSEQITKQTRPRQSDISEKNGVVLVVPYNQGIPSGLDNFVFADLGER